MTTPPDLTPTAAPDALELALDKSQEVKAKIEACAEDLSSTNELTKAEIADGTQLLSAHQVLLKDEAVERRVQECAEDLQDASEALAQGITDQKLTAQVLVETEAALELSQQAERATRLKALHDTATGCPKRELFDDRTMQAISVAKREGWNLAVMFLDLNGFKAVNDTHGHSVGDAVLKEVAHRLMKNTRSEDTMCRNGGDEFLYLLLNPGSVDNIMRRAELLQADIEQPIEVDGLSLIIKPSIGIAIYPEHGANGEELVKNADAAMYHAKKKQGGCIVF